MLLLVVTVKVLFLVAIYTITTILGLRALEKYNIVCNKDEKGMCNPFMFATAHQDNPINGNTSSLHLGISHKDFEYPRSHIESFSYMKIIQEVKNMEKEIVAYINEGDISSQFLLHRDINEEMLRIIKNDISKIKGSSTSTKDISVVKRTKLDKAFKEYIAILTQLYEDIQIHSTEVKEAYLEEHKEFIKEYTRLHEEKEKEQKEFYDTLKASTENEVHEKSVNENKTIEAN